jgi:ElaB/YqjD/DUF883 family membrane-anchored ribosome-binding protein
MNRSRMDNLGSRLHELLADIETLLDAGAEAAGEAGGKASDTARDSLGRVRQHLKAAQEEVSGRAREVDRAIHDNPWKAIAAVGVAAFLAGVLVSRR